MIRAVTFDFWNTLYLEDREALEDRRKHRIALVQGFFASAGREISAGRIREAVEELVEQVGVLRRHQHRNLSHAETGQALGKLLGFNLSDAEGAVLAELMSSAGLRYPPGPIDWAGNLLSRLQGRVRMGVISDTSLTFGMHLRDVMDAHGLAKYFDHFTWSDETLTCKPMERQFLYTLGMLDVRPGEAVHIGDLEDRDIAGAQSVGMRCILVRTEGEVVPSSADAVVESLAQVPDALTQWGLQI